jgi:hypothetical protein
MCYCKLTTHIVGSDKKRDENPYIFQSISGLFLMLNSREWMEEMYICYTEVSYIPSSRR